MSALVDYLLARHRASLSAEPSEHFPVRSENMAGTSVWGKIAAFLNSGVRPHNEMQEASEKRDRSRDGVYMRGLL